MWLKKAPYFLSRLQKALCWEQSSLPNPFAVTCHQHSRKPHLCALFSWALWDRGTTRWTDECSSYIEGLHCQRATKQWQHRKPMDGAQLPTLHEDTTLLSFSGCGYFNFQRARSCGFYLHAIKYLSPERRGSQIPHYFDGFNLSEHWSKRKILWWP